MATDPKARTMTVAYEGGTVSAALGLLQYLFGNLEPAWGAGSVGTTQTGRKRYKYGSRQKSNAAAGKQVFLDLTDGKTYSVRVTGNVVDFVDAILPKTGNTVARVYTRRGSEYAPTLEDL